MSKNGIKKGLLAVVSGFSGSGKSTITRKLIETYPEYALSISATTRTPRAGEQEGVDYFFKSDDEFAEMVEKDAFLEFAYYVDHGYGTPAEFVELQRDKGKDVLLEIEIQGALKVKARCPDAVLVFVTPPSAEELVRRLTARGTETDEVIRSRLRRAVEESSGMNLYDYILVNDDLEESVERLHRLLSAQHMQTNLQIDLIENMQKELAEREETKL